MRREFVRSRRFERFFREDQLAQEILQKTQSGIIVWKPDGFEEKPLFNWEIKFAAAHEGKALALSCKRFMSNGGFIANIAIELIATSGTEKILEASYHQSADYVETLDAGGDRSVLLLTSFLIEQFREPLKLHWSINTVV